MGERIINALIEIKGTLDSHSKSLSELRDGQNRIEGKIYGMEGDITDMKNDVVEINRFMKRTFMRKRLQKESRMVSASSLEALRELELIEDKLPK